MRADERLPELFHEALALEPAQRPAFARSACGGDAALERELMALLANADGEEAELHKAATAFRELADRTWMSPLPIGQRVAGFVVREVLARGGMGTVYIADQESPRRRVALKVLSAHLGGGELEHRFRHESTILAHLRHPGIAQIHDSGVVELDGCSVPWFALEFVEDARWITAFVRERALGLVARVALFQRVCEAVHHGHCKGVVHRDLKPANILVDANGNPKVIDFGVAKITDASLGDSLRTLAGEVIGTLGYMSPEQAQGGGGAIDTRSDVFSLGVVLYEVLTGCLPHDVRGCTIAAAARVVCEVAPDRGPLQSLPSDLRTIVLHALQKEPERRYGSAEALALDLDRWLRHEPIAARRPSAWYVMSRFVRRNRLLSATAMALLLALLLGIFGTLRGRWRAERAQAAAQWGRDFLVSMLYDADPWNGRGPRIGLGDALRGAVARLERNPPTPEIEADMRAVIGEVLGRLGEPASAEPQLRAAIRLLRQQGPAEVARAQRLEPGLAQCLADLGRLDEAEAMITQLGAEASHAVGSPGWLRLQNVLGRLRAARGDHEHAAAVLAAAFEAADALPERDEVMCQTLRNNQAMALRALGRLSDAEALLREVVEFRVARFGDRHPETFTARGNLAAVLVELGELEAADEVLAATRAGQASLLGEDDRRTLVTEHNQALVLRRLGRLDDAERTTRRVLAVRRRILGPEAAETLTTQANLAVVLFMRADRDPAAAAALLAEAEGLLREVLSIRERSEATPSSDCAIAHGSLGGILLHTQRYADAQRHFAAAVRIAAATLSDERLEPWYFRAGEAAARAAAGDGEALREFDRCVDELARRGGERSEVWQSAARWRREFTAGK